VVTVSSGGSVSNPVSVLISSAWPGLYSADGSGSGQAYILNSDGSPNSTSNPAAAGSTVTIFATGLGNVAQTGVSAYIDDLAAPVNFVQPAQTSGIPGNAYAISVNVPKSAFEGRPMPPQAAVLLVCGQVSGDPRNAPQRSQFGLSIAIQP
jgi:uncharacterized protein (TIGR03437 family)